MRTHLPAPRLLPVTMLAMLAVLGVKSAGLLRLGVPAHAESAAPTAASAAARPAAVTPAAAASAMPAAMPAAMQNAMQGPMTATPAAYQSPSTTEAPVGTSERALLLDLRHRRAELEARAQAVAAREALVQAAEKRLAARLDELDALQQRLQSLEAARKSRSEESWQGLVHIYETMKPKDAAVIFDDLDMPVLVQVMDRMQERKAALVLAAMDPQRARELTVELADMRGKANQIPDPPPATPIASKAPSPGPLPAPASAPAAH